MKINPAVDYFYYDKFQKRLRGLLSCYFLKCQTFLYSNRCHVLATHVEKSVPTRSGANSDLSAPSSRPSCLWYIGPCAFAPRFSTLCNEGRYEDVDRVRETKRERERKGKRGEETGCFLPDKVIPPADTPTSLSAAWRYTHPLPR